MERRFNRNHCKTPGTLRKPPGGEVENFSFEPQDRLKKGPQKTFTVQSLVVERGGEFSQGAQRRIPPLQFDSFGRPVTRSWKEPDLREHDGVMSYTFYQKRREQ